jgi:polyribonucleotide nucleotidyltransferase
MTKSLTRTTKNGQFKKGTSGNPSERPAGSRNKTTLLCEQLLEGDAEQLMQKALEMGKEGNIHALRLCIERIVAPRKERCVQLELQPIKTAQDLFQQFQEVVSAIAEGRITPNEGEQISNILASQSRILEAVELDRRVAALEENREVGKAYAIELAEFLRTSKLGEDPNGPNRSGF